MHVYWPYKFLIYLIKKYILKTQNVTYIMKKYTLTPGGT